MRKFFFITFFSTVFLRAYTQEIKYYTVQPGENIFDKVPIEEVYAYALFEQGIVAFKNGDRTAAMLNYNFFYEEMVFIDATKDTLALLNPAEVDCIYIKGDQYYYAKDRFVKIDTVINEVKLAIAGFFTTVNSKKIGAFGTATEGAINQFVGFTAPNGRKVDLTPNIITTYSFRKTLFIADKFNKFVPVNKKNIYNLYPEKEAQLKAYFQVNEVNFFSRKDVVDLLVYINK